MDKIYIFGYGSLICKEAREKTSKTKKAIPVLVKNLKRGWYLKSPPEMGIMGLGIKEEKGMRCNGVVFEISKKDLNSFDKREIGYYRKKIENKDITVLEAKSKVKGDVFVYIPKKINLPSKKYPLAQSYIDVILTGCFSFGDKFTKEFIQGTDGWSNHWINDRENPRYPRALKSPNIKKINRYLKNLNHLSNL
jgi:cation transport regulator ChaC